MKWQIEIDGKPVERTFDTEAEANQEAANRRGQNWSMKIEVRDLDAPKPSAEPKPQQPIFGAAVPLTDDTKPALANRK